MAVWQFTVSALELVGEDQNHWIQTRIVESVYKVQENSVIRLFDTPRPKGRRILRLRLT